MSALAGATPFTLRSLPSPEEWHKRKVALISGEFSFLFSALAGRLTTHVHIGITGQDGSYLFVSEFCSCDFRH
jgi:hypothetical protein